MPMRSSQWMVSLLSAAALFTGSGCRDAKREAAEHEAVFTTAAVSACRCEQRGGPGAKKGCWAKFEAAISPRQTNEGSTMCMPVSEDSRCWTADGKPSSPTNPEHCMTIAYRAALYRGGEALLCTGKEAKAAEAAWNQAEAEALEDTGRPGVSHAKRDAADATIRNIARGERFMSPRADTPGCG
jgi:hypothetical protein